MNRLDAPIFDDSQAILDLASNRKLASYPELQPAVPAIQNGYQNYLLACGDVSQINPVALTARQSTFLKDHYKKPPASLTHIKQIRDETGHKVCPMCGSFHSGTLDHVLPRATYPAFSIFSLNLVPACICNSKRRASVIGSNQGERVLHPYFDDCLAERLIAARFDDLGPVPRVSLKILLAPNHGQYAAVKFHCEEVLKKTYMSRYLADRWSKFCRRPSAVVDALASPIRDLANLRVTFLAKREGFDALHEGKNNWDSVFMTGLLDHHVLEWIMHQMSRPGYLPGEPLTGI